MEKNIGNVACPICGSINTIAMNEPRAVCDFCGETIIIGEKSGL